MDSALPGLAVAEWEEEEPREPKMPINDKDRRLCFLEDVEYGSDDTELAIVRVMWRLLGQVSQEDGGGMQAQRGITGRLFFVAEVDIGKKKEQLMARG